MEGRERNMSKSDGGFSGDGGTAVCLGRKCCQPKAVEEKKKGIVGVRGIHQGFLLSSGLE